MERKIGEIFNYDGERYQTVKSQGKCISCDFMVDGHCIIDFSSNGSCFYCHRKDKRDVIFKRLEKVGEPFPCRNMSSGRYGIIVQWYKVFVEPILTDDSTLSWYNSINKTILIALNNKEDMEEKKLNLKPFDLEAAKSGKPVCTRDGRKARIICFDYRGDANAYPILALISTINLSGVPSEIIAKYTEDGRYSKYNNVENNEDLMMLSERKEGWVNVYKETEGEYYMDKIIHKTEKFAFDVACPDDYIGTVKIEWFE